MAEVDSKKKFDLAAEKRKYKNVHEIDAKDYTFKEIGGLYTPKVASNFCAANYKYAVFHLAGGGGKALLCRADAPGRYSGAVTLATARSVIWSEFSPFNPNMLACATLGSEVQIWNVTEDLFNDEGKLKERFEPVVSLELNTKKDATIVRWNPAVNNIIAVVGKSKNGPNLWIYDISTSQLLKEYDTGHEIFHLQWDADGNKLSWTSRGTKASMFVVDPRTDDVPTEVSCGLRDPYIFYCGLKQQGCKTDYIGLSGIDNTKRKSMLQFYNADTLELVKSMKVEGTEQTITPMFDSGRAMLWSYVKTESRIYFHRFFIKDGDISWKLSPKQPVALMVPKGISGGCFMGQWGLDFSEIEIQRFFALSNETKSCYVYKMVVPRMRKSEFEAEFYPEVPSLIPNLEAADWFGGTDASCDMWSLDPRIKRDVTGAAVFVKKATYEELADENAKLKKALQSLEETVGAETLQKLLEDYGIAGL